MEFSTGITTTLDRTFGSFDAVDNYNNFLKNNSSFEIDNTPTAFEAALEKAAKDYPLQDKKDTVGLGNFASQIGTAFSGSLNAINNMKLEANRMQEDIAMGGSTNVHDAMIAAEKAELSMQMAVQIRNRIVSAYTEITGMAI